jgi:predicted double-glycine peptidase
VVKQRYDCSCGSASLAALLTYVLNDPVDEKIKDLSLFDLQKLAQGRGDKALGFRVHLS